MRNRNWAKLIGLVVLVLNLLAVAAFSISTFVICSVTETKVRSNYSYLDNAGVINHDALAKLPEGFSPEKYSDSVPMYIAGPALRAQRENACWGLAFAVANVVAVGVMLVSGRRTAAARDPAQE